MKGKLTNKDNSWYVTHITDDNGIRFGVDYPLNPTLEKYYFLDEDAEGAEVEFELITIDNGDNGVRYAKLIKTEYPELEGTMNLCNDIIKKRTGKMTEEEWQAAERGEISDEEIDNAVVKGYENVGDEKLFPNHTDKDIWMNGFYEGAKWYREQLKLRNEKR